MDRELLLEIGCEEIPASWLRPLTEQLGSLIERQLATHRLTVDGPVETYGTPRRLAARLPKVSERQTDLEEAVTGPAVQAGFAPDGSPTPAALGFARKHGVAVEALERVETPKGTYLAVQHRQRGRAAVDVLPELLGGLLRGLSFPKQMRWDAWLDDGRGELPFGRPIRWLLYLYGGRVVPFTIHRSPQAEGPLVQEIRTGAVTYGHRFLALSGRPGRSIKVRSFKDYAARLAEHFVVLDRAERRDRILRELDAKASRLGGRIHLGEAHSTLLDEVPDLVEYPTVVAGTFAPEFLDLPAEVLATTMIHHQHFVPVAGEDGRLKPAFLAVTNTQPENERAIARNAERVLAARLRDARFFWQADRQQVLASRLERLETILVHQALGSYRAKAERIAGLAAWIAAEAFGEPAAAEAAAVAGRLAKADLATDMVREFTELQGTMGGIYAREEGQPEAVWKAIYYHYLPVGVEADAPPGRRDLGAAAVSWAAVSLADKLDTITGLFAAGEEPRGSRDPFGLRRQGHGVIRILLDAPELTGVTRLVRLDALVERAWSAWGRAGDDTRRAACDRFLASRLQHGLRERGFRHDEVAAALGGTDAGAPLGVRRRAEALSAMRGSEDFLALAVLFKRVKNIAREISAQPQVSYGSALDRSVLTEPAEARLLADVDRIEPAITAALDRGDYRAALHEAAVLRAAVDRFFTEVFVMVEDTRLRTARLMLMVRLRDLVMRIADISQIGEAEVTQEA